MDARTYKLYLHEVSQIYNLPFLYECKTGQDPSKVCTPRMRVRAAFNLAKVKGHTYKECDQHLNCAEDLKVIMSYRIHLKAELNANTWQTNLTLSSCFPIQPKTKTKWKPLSVPIM